jgi:hypothetical protein
MTFVRTSELIEAKWGEIDFDAAEWRIPAERMKMKRMHIVPPAPQAIQVLRTLEVISRGSELLLPGERDRRKPIGNNKILRRQQVQGGEHPRQELHRGQDRQAPGANRGKRSPLTAWSSRCKPSRTTATSKRTGRKMSGPRGRPSHCLPVERASTSCDSSGRPHTEVADRLAAVALHFRVP